MDTPGSNSSEYRLALVATVVGFVVLAVGVVVALIGAWGERSDISYAGALVAAAGALLSGLAVFGYASSRGRAKMPPVRQIGGRV